MVVSTPSGTAAYNPDSANPLSPSRRIAHTASVAAGLCSTHAGERTLQISGNVQSPELLADNLKRSIDTKLSGSGDERQQGSVGRIAGECLDIPNDCMNPNDIKSVGSVSSVAPSMKSCSSMHAANTSTICGKRLLSDEDDSYDENENYGPRERERPRKRRMVTKPDPAEPSLRFACPYRKHDPRKYGIQGWRSCALSYWHSVSRVKFVLLQRCLRLSLYHLENTSIDAIWLLYVARDAGTTLRPSIVSTPTGGESGPAR